VTVCDRDHTPFGRTAATLRGRKVSTPFPFSTLGPRRPVRRWAFFSCRCGSLGSTAAIGYGALMVTEIPFRREIAFDYGIAQSVSPLIRRVVAKNPSPFTFKGTGTYIVGHGRVAVIDPGPDIAAHVDAVLGTLRGETITHILITHTHLDHSPAAAAVKQATGAKTYGFGPHGSGRAEDPTGVGGVTEEGGDHAFVPTSRCARAIPSKGRAGASAPSTRRATPPTISALRWPRSARCSRAITSWAGRPASSPRRTAIWRPTCARSPS